MIQSLTNKIAIVTGASKGIGAAIAKHLAAEGAAVAVNYASDQSGAERVVNAIESAGGRAIAIKANLTDPKEVTRLFAKPGKLLAKSIFWSIMRAYISFCPSKNLRQNITACISI